MTQSIDDLVSQAQERFAAAKDAAALENEKARFLGKDGALTVLLKGLGKLDPEQKREMGAQINQAKKKVEEFLNLGRARKPSWTPVWLLKPSTSPCRAVAARRAASIR